MRESELQTLNKANGYTDTQVTESLSQSRQYIDQRVNALENEFRNERRDTRAAIASAIAVASLPQPTYAGANMFSVAGGTWRGQQGFAVGFSGVTEDNRFIYKASGTASSQGDVSGGVAIGWQWK